MAKLICKQTRIEYDTIFLPLGSFLLHAIIIWDRSLKLPVAQTLRKGVMGLTEPGVRQPFKLSLNYSFSLLGILFVELGTRPSLVLRQSVLVGKSGRLRVINAEVAFDRFRACGILNTLWLQKCRLLPWLLLAQKCFICADESSHVIP